MNSSHGDLHCRLLDRRSGLPLRGAHITCSGNMPDVVLADADERGECKLTLPNGVYDLILHGSGYITIALRGIAVMAGATSAVVRALILGANIPVVSEPASAIAGRIIDDRGQGEANVSIQASSQGSTYMTQTDGQGHYFFHGVIPGSYTIAMRKKDGETIHDRAIVSRPFMLARVDFNAELRRATLESLLRIVPLDRPVDSNNR